MAKQPLSLVTQRLLSGALLCAVFGVVMWLVVQQQRREQDGQDRVLTESHLFHIEDANAVTHISLTTPKDGIFELVRDGEDDEAWHLIAPQDTLAEASTIEAMLKDALALTHSQLVTPTHTTGDDATDMSIFGLSPPQYRLALTTGSAVGQASTTQAIAIGKRNSFDGGLYVQREGAQSVAIVPGSFVQVVDRNLYKLRDKRVARIAPSKVRRIEVAPTAFGRGVTIDRDTTGFQLLEPLQARADADEVESLVMALSSLRGKSVVAEHAHDASLSLFGLQSPRFVVRLWLGDASVSEPASLTMSFGEIQMRGVTHTFARTEDISSPIWELGTDWVMQKLRQDAPSFRDMRVVHVDADMVAHVTVRQLGQEQNFARDKAADGAWSGWHLSEDPNRAIHPSLVAALVARVVHLKADRIVSETLPAKLLKSSGLQRPRVEVDLFDVGAHLLESVLFGASDKDGVFVTTDNKARLDHVSQRLTDEIAAAPATYFDTDTTP